MACSILARPYPFPHLPDNLPEAAFGASSKQHTCSCYQNTRLHILSQTRQWVDGQGTRRVYWLKGLAGTGKSTIALTVVREYGQKKRLRESFFFSRDSSGLALARRFVTTIAFQLTEYSQELRMRIREAVDSNPNISSKGLYRQWELLVLQSLSSAHATVSQEPLLIVVDALDESDGEDDIRALIQCLAAGTDTAYNDLQLRIFVTSRPDPPVNVAFNAISAQNHRCFVLQDPERSITSIALSPGTKVLALGLQQWVEVRGGTQAPVSSLPCRRHDWKSMKVTWPGCQRLCQCSGIFTRWENFGSQ